MRGDSSAFESSHTLSTRLYPCPVSFTARGCTCCLLPSDASFCICMNTGIDQGGPSQMCGHAQAAARVSALPKSSQGDDATCSAAAGAATFDSVNKAAMLVDTICQNMEVLSRARQALQVFSEQLRQECWQSTSRAGRHSQLLQTMFGN